MWLSRWLYQISSPNTVSSLKLATELEKTTNSSAAITSIDLQEINIQMEFCHLQSNKHLYRRSMLWPNIFVLLKSNTSFYQQFLVSKPISYEFPGSCQTTVYNRGSWRFIKGALGEIVMSIIPLLQGLDRPRWISINKTLVASEAGTMNFY